MQALNSQKKYAKKVYLYDEQKMFLSLIKNKLSGTENFKFVSFGCY
jgi:hypothetical protein